MTVALWHSAVRWPAHSVRVCLVRMPVVTPQLNTPVASLLASPGSASPCLEAEQQREAPTGRKASILHVASEVRELAPLLDGVRAGPARRIESGAKHKMALPVVQRGEHGRHMFLHQSWPDQGQHHNCVVSWRSAWHSAARAPACQALPDGHPAAYSRAAVLRPLFISYHSHSSLASSSRPVDSVGLGQGFSILVLVAAAGCRSSGVVAPSFPSWACLRGGLGTREEELQLHRRPNLAAETSTEEIEGCCSGQLEL
eukprot:scaffold2172_cov130-Isochrysis_galbana.AAC.5